MFKKETYLILPHAASFSVFPFPVSASATCVEFSNTRFALCKGITIIIHPSVYDNLMIRNTHGCEGTYRVYQHPWQWPIYVLLHGGAHRVVEISVKF